MVVVGLSAGRTETKELYTFLNSEDYISVSYESDLNNISWYDSENIIINRIKLLENEMYTNNRKNNKNYKIFGEVAFYFLPYLELVIQNFPYIKFIYITKDKNRIIKNLLKMTSSRRNLITRLFYGSKTKNHWMLHNGVKWEKDFLLDKCYPKYDSNSRKNAIELFCDEYYQIIRTLIKKYPNNLKIFYSDELKSDYGRNKVLSFIGIK